MVLAVMQRVEKHLEKARQEEDRKTCVLGNPALSICIIPAFRHYFDVSESSTMDSASEKGGPEDGPIPQGVRRRSSLNPKPCAQADVQEEWIMWGQFKDGVQGSPRLEVRPVDGGLKCWTF